MSNFEALFGDILQDITGCRSTPDNEEGSDFKNNCDDTIMSLVGQAKEIKLHLLRSVENLPDTALVDPRPSFTLVHSTVSTFTSKVVTHLPEAQAERIAEFVPFGAEAVCLLAHVMGQGLSPDICESYRDNVVLAASVMSRYPGAISTNFKLLLAQNALVCVTSGDLTEKFRNECFKTLTTGITNNPEHLASINKLHSCPARKHIGAFSELVFDLYAVCHRHIWERHSNVSGKISADTMQIIRMQALLDSMLDI